MRIAITFLTYGRNAFGGIERATHFLARGLVQTGAAVRVITGTSSEPSERELDGVQIVQIASLLTRHAMTDEDIRRNIGADREAIEAEIADAIRTFQSDYLLIVDPIWGILPLVNVWHRVVCPIGLLLHFCHDERVLSPLAKMPIRDIFAVSESLADELRGTSDALRSRDIQILPNCICLSEFAPKWAEGEDAVFVHTRISPEKGTSDAVQAFALVAPDFSSQLWLCAGVFPFGDVLPTRAEIEKAVARLQLVDRVRFLPNLAWSEIPRYVRAARLIVIPSYRETFGMAALEAMAAGTPLIVTRVGNLPPLVGDAALVVEPGDVSGLAEAMRHFLTDASSRRMYAARGIERARGYDAAEIAAKFLNHVGSSE